MTRNSTLIHNTIACDGRRTPEGGGCSADITGYPDFEPMSNWLVEHNLLMSNVQGSEPTICAYGGATGSKPYSSHPENATNIVFTGNVFQRGYTGRCGIYAPIAHYNPVRPGNSWVGNRWNTGEVIPVPD